MQENRIIEKRQLSTNRIVLSFLIATFLFSSGFLLGYVITFQKSDVNSRTQDMLRYDILGFQVQNELMKGSCSNLSLVQSSSELNKMRDTMNFLEIRFGKLDESVLSQKKIYTILQVQHFLLVKEKDSACKTKTPTLLFFYSNIGSYKDSAEKLGVIIDNIRMKNPDLKVYSFDFDLGSNLIKILKEKYDVTDRNTIVVNEETNIVGLKNADEIEKYLNNA